MEHQILDTVDSATAVSILQDSITNQNFPQIDNPTAMNVDTHTEITMADTMDESDGPPLTRGLEELLGGLGPLKPKEQETVPAENSHQIEEVNVGEVEMEFRDQPVADTATIDDVRMVSAIPDLTVQAQTDPHQQAVNEVVKADVQILSLIPGPTLPAGTESYEPADMENVDADSDMAATLPGLTMHTEESTLVNSETTTEVPLIPAPGISMDTEESTPVIPDTAMEVLSIPAPAPTMHTEDPTLVDGETTMEGISMSEPGPAAPEGEGLEEGEHPEWEVDSSPIESSSDDSSDDSSSESEDGENGNVLLSVEEQAKILMEGDGGSDDEGGGKAKGAGGPLRTKNEVPDVVIPKPDVTITPEMQIEELGAVETIVGNIILVKAKTSGEYRVLESGSVLCLEDKTIVGVVAETLGRVQQPLYSVMFTNATELDAAGLSEGTRVFYAEQYSTYVFTQALKAYKGSDASNLHDEEVGDEEVEFSDDEAEAEHKRRVKQAKAERRGGKVQQNGAPRRGAHPLQQQHKAYDPAQGISYDDAEDDGPYKPLARPSGYADSVGRSEAPEEGAYNQQDRPSSGRENFRGRGRGGGGDRGRGDRGRGDRGRGDRGRGRGDRGRGKKGFQDHRSDGYSLPPKPPQTFQPPPPGVGVPPFSHSPGATANFYAPQSTPQYPQLQSQLGWPQYPPQLPYQQQYPNMQNWPQMPQMPQMPPVIPPAQNGAFINPAFFPNGQSGSPPPQWNPQNQNGRGRGQ